MAASCWLARCSSKLGSRASHTCMGLDVVVSVFLLYVCLSVRSSRYAPSVSARRVSMGAALLALASFRSLLLILERTRSIRPSLAWPGMCSHTCLTMSGCGNAPQWLTPPHRRCSCPCPCTTTRSPASQENKDATAACPAVATRSRSPSGTRALESTARAFALMAPTPLFGA